MNTAGISTHGLEGGRPGREALPADAKSARRNRAQRRTGAEPVVPPAEFKSYYGRAILKEPVWQAREIAGYFFLGGLAGASSLVAAGAQLRGQSALARAAKLTAAGASMLSFVALVKDLGRPARFLNMLRVAKPTSPMNVGSWILAGFAPTAIIAALSETAGVALPIGAAATYLSAPLGAALATYTGVLVADTAIPAWHDTRRELPFVFASSSAAAAAGAGLVMTSEGQQSLRRLAVASALGEFASVATLERRLGDRVGAPYHGGRSGALMNTAKALNLAGALLAGVGRTRFVRALAGCLVIGASLATRFGVFYAGVASARDPEATIGPQRERVQRTLSNDDAMEVPR